MQCNKVNVKSQQRVNIQTILFFIIFMLSLINLKSILNLCKLFVIYRTHGQIRKASQSRSFVHYLIICFLPTEKKLQQITKSIKHFK